MFDSVESDTEQMMPAIGVHFCVCLSIFAVGQLKK